METSIRHKEIIRGKILYYLAIIYPRSATLPLLQGELDIFGYPVPIEELGYHVAYLVDKGLVSVENVRGPVPRKPIALENHGQGHRLLRRKAPLRRGHLPRAAELVGMSVFQYFSGSHGTFYVPWAFPPVTW